MSQPSRTIAAGQSAAEGDRNGVVSSDPGTLPSATAPPKSRSCTVCRTRRVRCDKQSPCSNCRRAGVQCVYPSSERPPRWARRFNEQASSGSPATPDVPSIEAGSGDAPVGMDVIFDRLRSLEQLVTDLRSQLDQREEADVGASAYDDASGLSSYHPNLQLPLPGDESTADTQKQFGRLVLQDAGSSRYVSHGYWSRVFDELDMLKMDTQALADQEFGGELEDEESSTHRHSTTAELERAPQERHAFLFAQHASTTAVDLREFHPLPSQVLFLLQTFSENVNSFMQAVHVPTVTKMVRGLRGDVKRLTPSNEALMFSIYYAAINSMDEDDVQSNFGLSKGELNSKYRLGFEHALAKANFLEQPDLTLIQALGIFLSLVRRHDSPRYVWMMVGLVIRMAHYLGLQRDGTHFPNLSPYDIEMRRRVWWVLCGLDLKSTEDQATDFGISSFDTNLPLSINDNDIDPDTKTMPQERDGLTDMTIPRAIAEITVLIKAVIASKDTTEQTQIVDRIANLPETIYRQAGGNFSAENMAYWVCVTMARLIQGRMTLIIYLPILFSNPSPLLRNTLLFSALSVCEANHALNSETRARQWRWLYQTCTHWHSIIYLLMELPRRQWSPLSERVWVALHSEWLIPEHTANHKHLRVWLPLRRLMSNATNHRKAELARLRIDENAADALEMEDRLAPAPMSAGALTPEEATEAYRQRWRQLLSIGASDPDREELELVAHENPTVSIVKEISGAPAASFVPVSQGQATMAGYGVVPWLWADSNPSSNMFSDADAEADSQPDNMNLDDDTDWYNWIQSATGMERDQASGSDGQS